MVTNPIPGNNYWMGDRTMTTREITIQIVCDDSGETHFILPSGFSGLHIRVFESPTDLDVSYITPESLAALLEHTQ